MNIRSVIVCSLKRGEQLLKGRKLQKFRALKDHGGLYNEGHNVCAHANRNFRVSTHA